MSKTLLDQLNTMTVAVADTGDFNSIEKFKPRDATTNPSLITAAAQMDAYRDVVDGALEWAQKEGAPGAQKDGAPGAQKDGAPGAQKDGAPGAQKDASGDKVVGVAIDRLAVEFGLRILKIVPGRVSTEVDARLSFDTNGTVEKGRALIKQYEAAGASRERVLIKIAATWEGIKAAEILEKEGIRCNLTLLFGMHQAVACAEANVRLISPFVGRILDWHKKASGKDSYAPNEDPGVVSVTAIYNYYKKYGHKTEVMGASFRNVGEIIELAGCDLLTIAPNLLTELQSSTATLTRKLDPNAAASMTIERIAMDEATFRKMHEADKMAKEKLEEGIQGFSKALVALEKLMGERLQTLQGKAKAGQAARQFFEVYDLDGDGFITREEWSGTDAVFAALDANGDGRVSPEELAAGLGAAFLLGN